MLSWLLQPILFFIPPLILAFLARPGSFVHRNALQGLVFQGLVFVMAFVMGGIFGTHSFLFGIFEVFAVGFAILGAVVSWGGSVFEPPISSCVAKSLLR